MLGVALTGTGTTTAPGPPAPATALREEAPTDLADPTSGVDPVAAVPGLGERRAAAFSSGDRAPLDAADVAGSPALQADLEILEQLNGQGAVLSGLGFELRDALLLSLDGDAAVLRVTTVTSAHQVVRTADGAVLHSVPASEPRTVDLALTRTSRGWLVREVLR